LFEFEDEPDFWICPKCVEAGLVPYCENFPPVLKKRGGPTTADAVFQVLPPFTEEEELRFNTTNDPRDDIMGNCSAI
jgi:hypothetical protein